MAAQQSPVNGSGDQSCESQYHEEHVSHDLPDGHPDIKPVFLRAVLIAVDESHIAEAAFEWYVDHIHRPDTHVTVFSVAEPPNMQAVVGFGAGFAFPVEEWQASVERRKEESRHLQQKYAKMMKEKNIHGKVTVYWSDSAGPGIDAYVKKVNKDKEQPSINLVVMGSRGLGKLRRTFMGSVSSYVLHHTHVPIVVAPPPKHGQHKVE